MAGRYDDGWKWHAIGLVGLGAWALAACSDPATVGQGTAADSSGSGMASGPGTTGSATTALPPDGSGSGEPLPPAACGEGFALPQAEQAQGDVEAGYHALTHEGYVSCGIPYSLFSLAQPLLGGFADGEPLPGREGNNADLPHNWTAHVTADGAEIVSLNCLECHAGKFNGELIVGLGKADADYTSNIGGGLGGIPVPDLPVPGIEQMARMAQRYQTLGPHIQTFTVGTNPADQVAAVLAAHHDPQTLEWFDEPQVALPDILLVVDTPPWWRVAKKNAMFYNGMARGDHRATMMFTSSLCTDSVAEAEQILTYFDDIRAYLASIEAPSYPFSIDGERAAQGQAVFERDCACCHGTYADDAADETYPNLLFPLDVVGTDPLMAEASAAYGLDDWFNASWYGQIGPLSPEDPFPGYVAPPLDGIWATAPFLHNGSVPSLELVLDSTQRPRWWRRLDYDSTHFDQAAVGWPWAELPYSWDDAPQDERRHVYDTTKLGHWNTGHTFGDHLTDAERQAVLEYLKTL
ncbi:MAG: hypothetical protein K0V04_16985 [Deltaproteobacteria bacterium]|nr:hypothetical protein [Deltaproteobacteria bacterium]